MRKNISKYLIIFFVMITFISSQIVFASEMQIFNNDHLRFGNGSEPSINNSGNLKQPFYFSQVYNGWRPLTFSSYPLDFEIREGGDGTNWWNLNGAGLTNPSLSGFTLNSTGFTSYDVNKGYGTIITNGTVNINGKDIQINNTYELSQGKSFIKVTTKFTNLSNLTVNNLRYWVGTQDDFVGGTDGPKKEKGNLTDGAFANISNQSIPAKALRISTSEEGVLFYTDTDKANIIIGDSFGWNYVISRDPATSPITVTSDNSYAFYVRLNNLEPNESDEIVWYYAAGPINELEEIVRDVASAASSVFNIGSETAYFKSSSSVSGTVYYMVVPSNSPAPNASQIESGANYEGVTVKVSGNGNITAGVEKTFTISGLNANTSYDLYIVVKDSEGKYSSISKNTFTTIKYSNTITFNQVTAKTYGDEQFLLGATTDSNLILSYTSSNTNVATVDSDGRVTIIGAGTTNITASQDGNEYYEPATSVTRTLTVNKKNASVTPNTKTKIYGEADPVLDGVLAGFLAQDNITVSYSRTTGESANTYTISAVLNLSEVLNNYNITNNTENFIIAKRSITVQAMTDNKIYDGTVNSDEIPDITEGILADGENAVLEQKFVNKDVGNNKTLNPSCKVFNQMDTETTPNYDISYISSASGEITLADPIINLENKTSSYTGNSIAIEPASVTGAGDETPPGNITYVYYTDRACTTLTTPGSSGSSANGQVPVYAGTYYVKATIEATLNYTSQTTAAPGTLIILPANGEELSIGSNLTKTYEDESFELIASGGSGTGAVTFTSSNPNVASVTANGYVSINSVGESTISATKASDGNYDSQFASITITVNKKPVVYTITNNTKTYTGGAQYADVYCDNQNLKAGSDYSVTYYKDNTAVNSPVEPGVYSIVVTTINSNYEGDADGTLTIANAGQIDFGIGGIPSLVEYQDIFTIYTVGSIGGTTTYEIVSGNAIVDSVTGLVNITGTGEVEIMATNTAENFEIKTATASFAVQPKTISVTAIASDRPYEPGYKNVEVELITGVEGLEAQYSSASMVADDAGVDKVVTVTGVTFNNENYKPESTTIYTTVTIGMILASDNLVISGLPSSITFEDDDFRLTAIGQGTGDVIWSSSDITVAKVNSSTGVVTIKGTGSSVITATKESDGNYEAVSSNITIEIGKKDVTYSIINNTKIYNGLAQFAVITPSAISLVEDVDYKVTYSQGDIEVDEPIEAGVYDIYIETVNANYDGESTGATLTILEANQTSALEIGGLPNYIEYEDSFALYANGGNGEGNVNWAIESGSEYADVTSGSGIISITGVGTVTVSATKEGDGNYNEKTASVTFTTNKKQVIVVISSILKTYNGNKQEVNIAATPTTYNIFEDIADILYVNQEDGAEAEFRNVGTYNVLVDVNDDYTEYYELSGSLSAVASINKADIIITADNKEKVYGDTNPEFTLSYNLLGTDVKEFFEEPSIICVADETSSVGEYDIVLLFEGDKTNSNYNAILSNGTLNITPALLTVTADDKSVYYGRTAPKFTYNVTGFKGNDSISDLEGNAVFDCEYVAGSVEGEYAINISGFTSNNYSLEYVPGKITVTPPFSSGGSGSSGSSGGAVSPADSSIVENQEENPFDDINENDWFYEAVCYVNKAGLMSGTDLTSFEPDLESTRSMIITVLYRVEKQPDIIKISNFRDVLNGSWYNDSVVWGAENGIVKGYDNENFGPDDKITREQLAAILYRYALYKGYINNDPSSDISMYKDFGEISSWAFDSMQWAVSQGIITGTTLTTLEPQGYATRAQTATCLMKFIQNVAR